MLYHMAAAVLRIVLWQHPGGSGSHSPKHVATPGQSPEQAPALCPEGLSSVGGQAGTLPSAAWHMQQRAALPVAP